MKKAEDVVERETRVEQLGLHRWTQCRAAALTVWKQTAKLHMALG